VAICKDWPHKIKLQQVCPWSNAYDQGGFEAVESLCQKVIAYNSKNHIIIFLEPVFTVSQICPILKRSN
jgi:hypothetical protein